MICQPTLALLLLVASAFAQDTEVVTETYENGEVRVERTVRRTPEGELVDHGSYESFHDNGKTESKGEYVDGKREGEWEFRWPNGKRRARGNYVGGEKHGQWTTWYEKGSLHARGSYEAGVRTGEWRVLKPDKSVDERRSGVYSFTEGVGPDMAYTYRGGVLNGLKDGSWIYSWPGGTPMFCVTYDAGLQGGDVYFFHRSGRLDPDWVSGRYSRDRWMTPPGAAPVWVDELVPASVAVAEAVSPAADVAPDELASRGRAGVPAALELLAACDLGTESGRTDAQRLHEEVLTPIFGGSAWPWPADEDPERVALLVDRWASAWFLLGDDDAAWERDFGEAYRWLELDYEETALGRPPIPEFVTSGSVGSVDPSAGMIAIGGGAGGKFGGRFGGRKKMRAVAGRKAEARLVELLDRLQAEQAADGSWSSSGSTLEATALALLALTGDANTLYAGPYREAVLRGGRWLVEQQDRASGRASATSSLHDDALATHVLAELVYYGPGPRKACERSVGHLVSNRLDDGAFPAQSGQRKGDPRATAAVVIALLSAEDAGIEVDLDLVRGDVEWLLEHTAATKESDASRDGAAFLAGVFARIEPHEDQRMQRLEDRLRRDPPSKDADAETLLHGGYAAYQAGGETWKSWSKPLLSAFLEQSARAGDAAEAARRALAMEVYFRYGRVLR